MTKRTYDVLGIGNALVDFLAEVDEAELVLAGLAKGEMRLVDEATARATLDRLQAGKPSMKIMPGGSCANTISGVARLGGTAAFHGAVGADRYGDRFEQALVADGVRSGVRRRADGLTGHAIAFITPDGQRTFAVHLGAALSYREEEVLEEEIRQSSILHLEGYLFDAPTLRKAAERAMGYAQRYGVMVSVDLADPGVVRRNRAFVEDVVQHRTGVLFANEEEAMALTELPAEQAVRRLAERVEVAVVKCGGHGSLLQRGERLVRVAARRSKAVDTTGAGDLYAAAVLYGLCRGWDLERCGRVASHVAGLIVEQIGARPEFDLRAAVREVQEQT